MAGNDRRCFEAGSALIGDAYGVKFALQRGFQPVSLTLICLRGWWLKLGCFPAACDGGIRRPSALPEANFDLLSTPVCCTSTHNRTILSPADTIF